MPLAAFVHRARVGARLRQACAGVGLALGALASGATSLAAEAAPAVPAAPSARTALGPLQGVWMEQGAVASYLGVPFAQPPVGEQRFEKARPSVAWAPRVLPATRFKPACMQQGQVPGDIGMAEDCLYLNIYVPQAAQADRGDGQRAARPVMVFLHGGRYWTGRSSENPVQKLAQETGAIVVTVAYRLNAFGFLADADRARTVDTNLGLQDQQLALRWLQQHIGAFGGDAQRLTLFGESAGAGSALLQLLDPSAAGLFQRAILQSTWQWRLPTLAQATAGAHALAARLNCPSVPSAAMLACLKQMPADKLTPALADSHTFQPTVDGRRIRAQPLALLESGQFNRQVPVLIGLNADEGHFMAMSRTGWKRPDQPVADAVYLRAARDALGPFYAPEQVEDILSWYAPQRAARGNWQALSALLGDFYLNCGSYAGAQALAARSRQPVRAYWFTHVSRNHTKPFLGATHGDELDLLFAAPVYPPGYPLTADDQALSRRMMQAWGRFARTGRAADQPDAVPWPAFTQSSPQAQVWSEPASASPHRFADASGQCARWRTLLH